MRPETFVIGDRPLNQRHDRPALPGVANQTPFGKYSIHLVRHR
jgi:hypothetical protein